MLDSHYEQINRLVRLAQEGDPEALLTLGQFYRPLLQAALGRCLRREPRLKAHREDVEGEILIVFHDLVRAFDPALSYFSYYVSTRIDHALLSRSRRLFVSGPQGCEEVTFSQMPEGWEPQASDGLDPFGKLEDAVMLQDAVRGLNQAQQDAIQLHFYQGLTQQEAAGMLGISQSSFCKRLQRALANLKALLDDHDGL